MLRSLIAIISAVIVGFSTAKFVEGGVGALLAASPGSAGYSALLAVSWLIGAFTAALIALLIGRRWAPLGGLGAGAILLSAMVTLASFPLHWVLWPVSLVATVLGGYAAIRITGAVATMPKSQTEEVLFDD